MDEIEAAMRELGSAFAVAVTQPGSMQAVVTDGGYGSQICGAAGDPARIGGWNETVVSGLFTLRARVKSREGIQGVLLWR